MITTKDDMVPVRYKRRLAVLAARWPVGTPVRHETGWTGTVTTDVPGNVHGLGLDAAHVLIGDMPDNVAVCVEAVVNGVPCTAWYRPGVLAPPGTPTPAKPEPAPRQVWPPKQRKRTWRAA